MKVLVVGYHNPNFKSITEYIEDAFSLSGCIVETFDDRSFIFPGRLRDRFSFLQCWDLNRLNSRLIRVAKKFKPDFVLVSGGNRVLPNTLKQIKLNNMKTVLWTVDAPREFESIKKAAPEYDYIFCGGTEAVELLQPLGLKHLEWLPFACDSLKHKKIDLQEDEQKKYGSEVVFIGSYYPNRAEVFENLLDIDFAIWGPGWDKLDEDSLLKSKVRKAGNIAPEEWLKILSASKISLVVHFQDPNILCYQASPKVYESMACSCMVLSDSQKDVMALFENKKDLVWFETKDQLKGLVNYYLANNLEREEIAKSGCGFVFDSHTYKNRVNRILEVIASK